jgi:N-acetylglucosaminyl-diphospho-decaprenol L-rhamnosyltransferase
MIDLSIIIVNWNSADYLSASLSSVFKGTEGIRAEVIVVDNASHDECEAILQRDFPSVRLLALSQNVGFSRANNIGYAVSSGETLLFLNPDTEVTELALPSMLAWLRSNPTVGAVGARLLNSDGTLQESCVQAFPTVLNQLLDSNLLRRRFSTWEMWGTSALLDPRRIPIEVDAISGACFMVRRSVFEKVGRFSEGYFMYSEDLELSYKIRQAGFTVVCLTDSEVVHHGGKSSSKQYDSFTDILQRESMARFLLSTRGRLYSAFYRVAVCASALLRITIAACLLPLSRQTIAGRSPRAVMHKWRKVLGWALGLEPAVRLRREGSNA